MPPALMERPVEQTVPTRPTGVTQADEDLEVAPEANVATGEEVIFLVEGFYFDLVQAEGEYVASEPQTGMYGEGDSAGDAVVNLLGSLAALRAEIRSRGELISPEHRADLAFLDRILWV